MSVSGLSGVAQTTPVKKFTVTIDAGHGGHDTGAPGKKSVEKNLALGIALKLGHYMESLMEDVNVFYTRKTDVFVPLYERAQIANKNNSDLFISIHVNAVEKKTAPNGTSTYVMGLSKTAENLDLVMQENKAIFFEKDYQIKYADFDPTSPISYINFNNVKNNNLSQSLQLAAAVQDQLRTRGQRKDIGVHQGNLVVLWGCAKPSVLIETGFISNPQEEEFLMTEDGQDVIAYSIYMAIREYKEAADAKVNIVSKVPNGESDKRQADTERRTRDTVSNVTENQVQAVEVDRKSGEGMNQTHQNSKNAAEIEKQSADEKKTNLTELPTDIETGTGTEYCVQVLASAKRLPPNAKEFKGVKNLKEYKVGGFYKYMTQPVRNHQEALELRRQLAATFRDAFIVEFRDGERVPLSNSAKHKN
jgi:N-acetylmuramoyl-L-alanine amidase